MPEDTFDEPSLNRFIARGRPAWSAVRSQLRSLAAGGDLDLTALGDVAPLLPVRIGDFVDFYSSIEHATNVSRRFRPDDADPLPAAWRSLPIGYHGRAGSIAPKPNTNPVESLP